LTFPETDTFRFTHGLSGATSLGLSPRWVHYSGVSHSFASQLANGARGVVRAPEPSPRLAACLGGGAR